MIGSPRYNAIQAATEAATPTEPERTAVANAAIADLEAYKARTAEAKIAELYTTCSRCRINPCTAMWDDFRVCEGCAAILDNKYALPADPRGNYQDGHDAGRTSAWLEAAEFFRLKTANLI